VARGGPDRRVDGRRPVGRDPVGPIRVSADSGKTLGKTDGLAWREPRGEEPACP